MTDWTEWAPKLGKPANGPAGGVVAIQLRSGAEIETPRDTAWTHVGSGADIVAYRSAA